MYTNTRTRQREQGRLCNETRAKQLARSFAREYAFVEWVYFSIRLDLRQRPRARRLDKTGRTRAFLIFWIIHIWCSLKWKATGEKSEWWMWVKERERNDNHMISENITRCTRGYCHTCKDDFHQTYKVELIVIRPSVRRFAFALTNNSLDNNQNIEQLKKLKPIDEKYAQRSSIYK